MTRFLHAPDLQHPEQIHPSLWRGSELAHSYQKTISTGYEQLDAHLPGKGWPAGALIEIISARPGVGEIQLLKPVLRNLQDVRSITLVNPPYIPSSLCLKHWLSSKQRVFWIRSDTARNTLWATEKILQYNTSAALLCWINDVHPASLRRLHLAARQSHTLFFSLRPASAATQSSVATLRLSLEPCLLGLNIKVLKRRGPPLKTDIHLPAHTPDGPNLLTTSQSSPDLQGKVRSGGSHLESKAPLNNGKEALARWPQLPYPILES